MQRDVVDLPSGSFSNPYRTLTLILTKVATLPAHLNGHHAAVGGLGPLEGAGDLGTERLRGGARHEEGRAGVVPVRTRPVLVVAGGRRLSPPRRLHEGRALRMIDVSRGAG